jgi:hypothetical protein
LKCGFSHSTDPTFGGNQDFCAQLVYFSLLYRFYATGILRWFSHAGADKQHKR